MTSNSAAAASALFLSLASAMILHSTAQAAPPTWADADAGGNLFKANCIACHGAALSGGEFGPSLKGGDFAAKWAGNADNLQRFIAAKMPPANPGRLSPDDYRELTAYIASQNGWTVKNSGSASSGGGGPVALSAAEMEARYNRDGRHLGYIPAPLPVFADSPWVTQAAAERDRLLAGVTPVSDAMLHQPPATDWLTWRGGQDTLSFSPLHQIDRHNVARLGVGWVWSLPTGPNEIAPLEHDGVLYVASVDEVDALNAATGTLLWRYVRDVAPQFRGTFNQLHRSIAMWEDNIYVATSDRHIVALAARTGRLVWDTPVIPDDSVGMFLTSGPFVAHGKILQGTSVGTFCVGGCYMVGLDALTGKEIWRFRTAAAPGKPGGDTWNGASMEKRYGGSMWVPGSYDPELNLVYFGVAQTYELSTLLSAQNGEPISNNDALYMDSTVALNPDTGKLVWYHQHLQRDVWDLDEVFERTLIDVPIGGKMRKLLLATGKIGILDALDRADGSYLFSKDFGLNNIVTGIDSKNGRRIIDPAMTPKPEQPLFVCPSTQGARNWMTVAYNPQTRVLYLPMEESCMDLTWQPSPSPDPADHGIDMGWSLRPRPHSDGKFGRLEAVDITTRKTLWSRRDRAPLSSSLLATAGGIVFNGDRTRAFRASDDRTGETLWQTRLGAVPNASPITYSVAGRQYVAIVAGGTGPHDGDAVALTPEIDDGAPSTTLWVFALPDRT